MQGSDYLNITCYSFNAHRQIVKLCKVGQHIHLMQQLIPPKTLSLRQFIKSLFYEIEICYVPHSTRFQLTHRSSKFQSWRYGRH